MAKSRLSIAKADIVKLFNDSNKRVYTKADLDEILGEQRAFWRLAKLTTVQKFIEYMVENAKMRKVSIKLPFRPTNRYIWGEPSIYEIVQSLRPTGYFSHYTAIKLHGLTEQIPKTIYINSEQIASGEGGELTQRGIDTAFRNKCRTTNNRTVFEDWEIVAVNGRNTNQLGVMEIQQGQTTIRVTDVERTLIDATVRPVYCGGTSEVAEAFKNAHGKFSVNRLSSYLKKLNFNYPYHQAIGFYLERSGKYTDTQISLFRNLPIEFDFFLTHKMEKPTYNDKWKLYIPQGL